MTATYTWDNAMVEGRRRLALLERELDPTTFRRLEGIGVREGWRCLDLGAGGGTVVEWLCKRVGETGRVAAMDLDARFVRALPFSNLDVREENVVTAPLTSNSFDLIHSRWTLLHIPEREAVLRKLIDALKPGGILFLEEADSLSVSGLERTAFSRLCERVWPIIGPRGSNVEWARTIPQTLHDLGLGDLRSEAEFRHFHGGSDTAEFWKISWTAVRDAAKAAGADVRAWDVELAQLDDPTTLHVGPTTFGVIARKP